MLLQLRQRNFLSVHMGPSIKCVRKIFRKTNISNPLIRTRTWVRNVSFWENFAYVLNGSSLFRLCYKPTTQTTKSCGYLGSFAVNFVHFIHHQFCTLHRSQKTCAWLAEQFRTFHPFLHESGSRSSSPDMFLGKSVLKICSKFTYVEMRF